MVVSFSPSKVTTRKKERTLEADELALRRAYLQRVAYLRRRAVLYDVLKTRLLNREPSTQDVVNIMLHLLNDMKASDANELRAWGHLIGDAERKNGLR
jgi:hypothetical protein